MMTVARLLTSWTVPQFLWTLDVRIEVLLNGGGLVYSISSKLIIVDLTLDVAILLHIYIM